MNSIIKYLLAIIIFYFFIGNIQSQNKKIDNLEKELSIHTQKDTVRVNLLNSLAFAYRRYNITLAEEKSIEANNLAKEIDYEKGLAKSILIFSKIHISKSEYAEALEDCLKSLKLYEKLSTDNYKGIIGVYNTLGMISNYQNDSDTSVKYFKKALNLAKEKGDLGRQGDMLGNIGVTYYSKGELEDAITFYKKAIVIYEKMGDSKRSATIINNIAVIYTIQGRYTEALEYYNKDISIQREENNKKGIATATQNIGILYAKIDQYKKAHTYFEESLKIFKELEEKSAVAKSLNNIGDVFVASKDYKKALKYFTESLSISKEVNNKEALASCYNNIGKVHLLFQQPKLALNNFESSLKLGLSLGDKRNISYSHINLAKVHLMLKNYPKALHHAKEGEQLADSLEMLAEQKQVNEILSKIYEATGKFKKSLDHFKQHKILNDSLFNKKNIEKITQLEYEYKYKKKLDSANIRELKLTKTVKTTSQNLEKSQRNLFLGVISFLIVTLILAAIIFYLRLRNEKSKTKNIVIEQKLLRSQMTPHFIFNSLSVLQGMILNKEEKKSVSYLSKFSKLLRIILENSRDKTVLLSQELTAVGNYLTLQNLEDESYKYTILVNEDIDTSLFKVPPMLIQPFVENAIEHAFENQKEKKIIDIRLTYSNKKLICTIADNGIGVAYKKESKNQHKNSLSTAITSERLKILSKDFKMEGSVTIKDRRKYNEKGTIVTLVIPYKIHVS